MRNKKTAAFRITADLCFYFAVLHVFAVFREQALPLALFVAAAYFATLAASCLDAWPLRFLPQGNKSGGESRFTEICLFY